VEADLFGIMVEAEPLEVSGLAHQLTQVEQPFAACGRINSEGDGGHTRSVAAG
ncbi:uncharacterized protein METZ01_LOCUS78061, partial [marine metagenome]|tara:strand:- start:408 stop:566 length:159 start_codon:yes stop_codon:yes gene_type:complete